ncbi:MAG: hypothetical protein M0Q45_06125 [Bacteroidales bacterium]|nr:hypothetical protein [Bacteroidales bacterium]MCK9499066.1 hypothetical protein [Bacteroidales bacterium]MDY0315124.1 hypothetical protein [Bacteroidales bacterium]
MKKTLLLFILSIISLSLFSQVEEPKDNPRGEGFGAIMINFRNLDNKLALYTGGGGGFVVKDFRIGAFFNGISNSFSKSDSIYTNYKLGCAQGGLWFGYPFFKKHALHGLAEMKFSLGNTKLINTNFQQTDTKIFWGFNPSLAIEYDIIDILKVAIGVEYQYSYFPKPPDLYPASAFSSPGVFVSIKLGSF